MLNNQLTLQVRLIYSIMGSAPGRRSELIKDALMAYLRDRIAWDQIFTAGAGAAKKLGIKNEKDVYKIVEEYKHGENSTAGSS